MLKVMDFYLKKVKSTCKNVRKYTSRNLICKSSQKLLNYDEKLATDTLETASKSQIKKQ